MFWTEIAIDLTGATLIDFVMIEGASRWASFTSATFCGNTFFIETDFPEYVNFEYATFSGDTHFVKTNFKGDARFRNATINGNARFGGIMKSQEVTFSKSADFEGVHFNRGASFAEATFSGTARFGNLTQEKSATFVGKASFWGSHFSSGADFAETEFLDKAEFRDAYFASKAPSSLPKWGVPTTDFRSAKFTKGTPPEVAHFTDRQRAGTFGCARDREHEKQDPS
jgi:uncharacterized protein YjbI with pentapeptide repeats